MILIYANNISARLQYVSRFVFGELMGAECSITDNRQHFLSHPETRINYSEENLEACNGRVFTIIPAGLLFENGIRNQQIICEKKDDLACFFLSHSGDWHFDILSAVFYLISRYEEYLEKEKDEYGRFPHKKSLAFKEGFLKTPLVNQWANAFAAKLKSFFPDLKIKEPAFRFIPTYDIDIAYSYKGKGFVRNLGGLLAKPSLKRLSVLFAGAQDPFDSYDYLDQIHQTGSFNPIYFFLTAAGKGKYDKNIQRESHLMAYLIRKYASLHQIGIHPSWKSNDDTGVMKEEKKFLENTAGKPVTISRQHYIKMNLPETYRNLIDADITDDHSMGYGSINGFRASVAHSFFWYDLEKETETSLRIHPFCFMEANSYYEMKQKPEEALQELIHYLEICRKCNGTLITIFHNNFLGTDPAFAGWKEIYSRFISQVQQ